MEIIFPIHEKAYLGRISQPCRIREPMVNHKQLRSLKRFSRRSGFLLHGCGLYHSYGVNLNSMIPDVCSDGVTSMFLFFNYKKIYFKIRRKIHLNTNMLRIGKIFLSSLQIIYLKQANTACEIIERIILYRLNAELKVVSSQIFSSQKLKNVIGIDTN